MTPRPKLAARVVMKYGAPLVIASAGYMGFVSKWEADKKQATRVYADRLARRGHDLVRTVTRPSRRTATPAVHAHQAPAPGPAPSPSKGAS